MAARYDDIAESHQDTFQWILQDPPPGFLRWLQTGSGIFWLSGKAASGKSTLMKYMCQQRQLRKINRHWKASHANATLATASFFFNARGTELEKSQEGLLRSILHKLLSDDPLLIRQIFHQRWIELLQTLEVAHPITPSSWSLSVLKNALAGVLEASNKHLLLFVDGLDEYHGTSCAVLIDLMKRLSTSSHVKICLSSRPLQIFEEAFENADKLRLQDLTAGDIEAFTTSKLEANLRFRKLAKRDPGTSHRFYHEIFSKASGVFLWVALVVDSVIDGLQNRDHISQILADLQSLPSDLKDLYNDMLNPIRPKYQESSVSLSRIMLCMEEDQICPLALLLAHDGSAEALEIAKRCTGHAEGRIDDVTVWLKVRCAILSSLYAAIPKFDPERFHKKHDQLLKAFFKDLRL